MTSRVKVQCVWPTLDGPYRRVIHRLGRVVARRPLGFLIVPILVSLACAYPFVRGISDYRRTAITRAGAIDLFTPSNSQSERDRRLIASVFPDGGYFRDRTVVAPGLFVVLVSAKEPKKETKPQEQSIDRASAQRPIDGQDPRSRVTDGLLLEGLGSSQSKLIGAPIHTGRTDGSTETEEIGQSRLGATDDRDRPAHNQAIDGLFDNAPPDGPSGLINDRPMTYRPPDSIPNAPPVEDPFSTQSPYPAIDIQQLDRSGGQLTGGAIVQTESDRSASPDDQLGQSTSFATDQQSSNVDHPSAIDDRDSTTDQEPSHVDQRSLPPLAEQASQPLVEYRLIRARRSPDPFGYSKPPADHQPSNAHSDQPPVISILDDFIVNEYRSLRNAIENLTVHTVDGRSVSLRSICRGESMKTNDTGASWSWNSRCQPDGFLTLWTLHRSGLLPAFTYPYVRFDTTSMSSSSSNDPHLLERLISPSSMYIGPLFGGVRTDSHGRMQSVKYVRMIFRLPSGDDDASTALLAAAFSQYLDEYRSESITINYWVSQKYAQDMRLISKRVVKLLPALILLLLTFALVSCCMRDCVLSKPWLAVGGLVSAGLGLQVGFAVLFLIDVDLIEIAMIVPFLVLSIGLDDTFVMLNVWRSTDPRLSVERRMGIVFEEAAVSITITSITDVAAFLIGLSSVFPAVRIFCAFCASALFAVFVYQLTFFGACMTYAGRMEAQRRHCLTFRRVAERSGDDREESQRNLLDQLFCATSTNHPPSSASATTPTSPSPTSSTSTTPPTIHRPWPVLFFRNHFAPWLRLGWVKIGVGISYTIYIGTSVFFLIAFLRQGLQVSNLVPYDSTTHDYLSLYERYFSKCSTSAEVLIVRSSSAADDQCSTSYYASRRIQRGLVDWALSFENTDFTYKIDFWLYQYVLYGQRSVEGSGQDGADNDDQDEELSDGLESDLDEGFVRRLDSEFLVRYPKYRDHVTLGECPTTSANGARRYVNGSRFYVELANMGFENRSSAMRILRDRASRAPNGFRAYVYDVSFPLAEQYDAVLPGVIYDVGVGVGCMLVVACMFVPHLVTCLCIAFTVFSINVGVLGYMAVWGVNLDIISTITILLSIGFSVDYTSHVAYHFYVARGHGGKTPYTVEDKVAEALETAGWPILQSSLSMMVGVVTVLGVRAYISDTFVKTVLLVMLIGVYHALVVLPVLLSVVSPSPDESPSPSPIPSSSTLHSSTKSAGGRTIRPLHDPPVAAPRLPTSSIVAKKPINHQLPPRGMEPLHQIDRRWMAKQQIYRLPASETPTAPPIGQQRSSWR